MSEHEIPQVEGQSSAPELYTPKKIANLLINSFRFSRGTQGAQTEILMALAYLHNQQFSEEAIFESAGIAEQSALKIVENPKAHPQGHTHARVSSEVHKFARYLRNYVGETKTKPYDTAEFRAALIKADAKWLPGGEGVGRPIPDIYSSNLVKYGVLGQSASMAEYDELFRLAIAHCQNIDNPLSSEESEELKLVLAAHAEAHPEDVLAIEQFAQGVQWPLLEVADAA